MEIGQIVKGHANELLGLNKDLVSERMKICKKCPLFAIKFGQEVCNNKLYLNIKTGEISTKEKEGFKRGCGCRLRAKTTLAKAKCPFGKW